MSKDIQGVTVVVVGGAGGIGLSIADAFLRRGARLAVLLDRDQARGARAAGDLNHEHGPHRATFILCDVTTDLEKVTKIILDAHKTVDVLVNSAGIVNELEPRKMMEINAVAVIEWSLKFFDIMRMDRGGKGGTIINISSLYGFIVDPFLATYKASKYAVMGFTKTKGHLNNFKKSGVRLIAICPGATITDLTTNNQTVEVEENREEYLKACENLPWQEPEDVGAGTVEVFQKAESGTAWLIQGVDPKISEV